MNDGVLNNLPVEMQHEILVKYYLDNRLFYFYFIRLI
jgi:hypothetical protein